MTHQEITAVENAARISMAWTPEGYDGRTHYKEVAAALLPAAAILLLAAVVLSRLLA